MVFLVSDRLTRRTKKVLMRYWVCVVLIDFQHVSLNVHNRIVYKFNVGLMTRYRAQLLCEWLIPALATHHVTGRSSEPDHPCPT